MCKRLNNEQSYERKMRSMSLKWCHHKRSRRWSGKDPSIPHVLSILLMMARSLAKPDQQSPDWCFPLDWKWTYHAIKMPMILGPIFSLTNWSTWGWCSQHYICFSLPPQYKHQFLHLGWLKCLQLDLNNWLCCESLTSTINPAVRDGLQPSTLLEEMDKTLTLL